MVVNKHDYEYFSKEKKKAKKLYKLAFKNLRKVKLLKLINKATIDDIIQAKNLLKQEDTYYHNICNTFESIKNGTFEEKIKKVYNLKS